MSVLSEGQSLAKSRPVIGVSECLMGKEVRFNGGHKRSRYITDVLAQYFDFVPLCPEVAIGMSIPRPPIRLAQVQGEVRVIATDSTPGGNIPGDNTPSDNTPDYTDALKGYARSMAPQLSGLSGFIFMQKSPSCGVGSTKVYGPNGHPVASSNGAFAGELMDLMPQLPVTEAGQLNDNPIRENFITQIYAYHEWQQSVASNPTAETLVRFHHRYKLHLMAHSETIARQLGQLLSNLKGADLPLVSRQYIALFMQAMRRPAPRKRQVNVLVRLQRFLKKKMSRLEATELTSVIDYYRDGVVPLVVPMTLLRHFMSKYEVGCSSAVFAPYPFELGLQNGI
jgi:uncharacterized protein YbgA (DUF1722 family)/uncharacterized protein YbbK (DUF523 family)